MLNSSRAAQPSQAKPKLNELREALNKGQLLYFYQPKVDMRSGLVCGAEALMRWRRPDGQLVQPGDFIPLAESSDFILELSRAMLPRLYEDMAAIHEVSTELTVSVNASVKNIADTAFINDIEQAVRHGQVFPGRLEIEVTETAVNDHLDLIGRLRELVELDVAIAMDDFGRGYSSIDALGRLPFTIIKLDQDIIRRLETSAKDLSIVQTSIGLAHQIGLKIVAEGIESAEIFQTLQFSGCTVGQGYWISRPLPLAEFIKFLRQHKRWAVVPVGLIHMVAMEHLRWRKAIIDTVLSHLHVKRGKSASLQRVPELNPLKCRFGQWYYGAGRQFVGIRWYDAMENPHNGLHKIAGQIVLALEQRRPDAQVYKLLQDLTRLSGAMMQFLQQLEIELVSRVSRHTTTSVRAITDAEIAALRKRT